MRELRTLGFHHITMVSRDASRTLDFYSRVLGLRLVKKTVNFDDPASYHLYLGDTTGSPGTILTFFEWRDVPKGRWGVGGVHHLADQVSAESSRANVVEIPRTDPGRVDARRPVSEPDDQRVSLALDGKLDVSAALRPVRVTDHVLAGFVQGHHHVARVRFADAAGGQRALDRVPGRLEFSG